VPYESVPFFWTRQFDAGLVYVGHAATWDEIIYDGAVSSQDFLAFYVKGGRVLAVAGMNRDRELAAVEELIRLNRMPTPEQLKWNKVNVLEMLHAGESMSAWGAGRQADAAPRVVTNT
jgi:hypothetical protein